jgi:tetratricopeptide (TPR) repeat protein
MLAIQRIMHWSLQKIGDIAISILAVIAIVWWLVIWWQRVRDRKEILIRAIISVALSTAWYFGTKPLFMKGGYAAIGALFLTVAFGWIMAIIWARALSGWVGGLFGGLFDGGSQEVEAKPFYSVFRAKRTKGKYFEALAEVRKQLEKFPADFEGHMLLAELQAENLNDLPGAEVTIHRCCNLPGQTPGNISFALNKLADWHLGLTKDREAAQRSLERIMEMLPDSDVALRAAQRIGHLADTDMLLAPHDRERVEVKKGVRNLGLHRGEDGRLKAPQVDWEKEAAEYVAQLEMHPLDAHAREKLAEIYAKHYHRLDLAMDQLEQLIQQPGHPARQVVRWLNLMADLQVVEGADMEAVRATLERIIVMYPDIAAAETARRRIDILKLEARAKEKPRAVQLGEYEQDIGLKKGTNR